MKRAWRHVPGRGRCTSVHHVVAATLVTSVIYCEILSYLICRLTWPSLQPQHSPDVTYVRVLFVADPQLIGYEREDHMIERFLRRNYLWPAARALTVLIGAFSRWDSDRYVGRGFHHAAQHLAPEVVVFCGDLLDEGSTAPDVEVLAAATRFKHVFPHRQHMQHIYLAGDNDVGGESDKRTPEKIQRFYKSFYHQNITTHKFVDFLTAHHDDDTSASDAVTDAARLSRASRGVMRVIVNHMSVVTRRKPYSKSVIDGVNPHIIVSGHTHKATLHTCLDCRGDNNHRKRNSSHTENAQGKYDVISETMTDSRVLRLRTGTQDPLYQIDVPTCSYRMGVPAMGYGAALLGSDGSVQYAVLWLPSRYKQLTAYLIVTIAIACIYLSVLLRHIVQAFIFKNTYHRRKRLHHVL